MCESVAGRWDLGRTSHLSVPAVQFCAQGLLSAVLLCGCNTVAIASVYGGSRSSGLGFYVSCRGCRAVGLSGLWAGRIPVRNPRQDPRQEPPSGSPSGCPSTPSTPSTPVNTPSTSVNPVNPRQPRHGPVTARQDPRQLTTTGFRRDPNVQHPWL